MPLATDTVAPTAAEIVALMLDITPADQHDSTLQESLARWTAIGEAWEAQHLRYVEQGWEDLWQRQSQHQQLLIAEIRRVLAERFGA
jgi:hypothetical protein